jgi:pyruvyl transferase EpsO
LDEEDIPPDAEESFIGSRSSSAYRALEVPRPDMVGHLRKCLLESIGKEIELEPYALLDYPGHANAGDSAIWLGELALLRELLLTPPSYVCTWNNCDAKQLEMFDGQILLHGGGNFGDLWPRYHGFRLSVLRRFPKRRIVQLPQTIHFNDPLELEVTRRIIGEHGNFMLFVRDQRSLEIARTFDCEVALAPDSAFMVDLDRTGEPDCDVLYLHRDDKERAVDEGDDQVPAGWQTADWSRAPFPWTRFRTKTFARQLLHGNAGRQSYRAALFEAVAAERVSRAVALLSRGRRVVTDRLHGHILCTLVNIPHCVLDNSYGKLSSFASAWGTTGPGTPGRMARNIAEIGRLLESEL